MTAIAWAILAAACMCAPIPQNENYTANNAIRCWIFVACIGMMIYKG